MNGRPGAGELTMHHRAGPAGTPITCGVTHGCITAVWGDVTCQACKDAAGVVPVTDPIVAALRAERQRRGLTLQQVGKWMGLRARVSVWHWESGNRQPTLPNLREWASALGYDLALTRRDEEG